MNIMGTAPWSDCKILYVLVNSNTIYESEYAKRLDQLLHQLLFCSESEIVFFCIHQALKWNVWDTSTCNLPKPTYRFIFYSLSKKCFKKKVFADKFKIKKVEKEC